MNIQCTEIMLGSFFNVHVEIETNSGEFIYGYGTGQVMDWLQDGNWEIDLDYIYCEITMGPLKSGAIVGISDCIQDPDGLYYPIDLLLDLESRGVIEVSQKPLTGTSDYTFDFPAIRNASPRPYDKKKDALADAIEEYILDCLPTNL